MDRDKQVLDLLDRFNVATSSQIKRLYFNKHKQADNICRRRLLKLYNEKFVKRERSHIDIEYIYYNKKNNQFPHSLILTEFYVALNEIGVEVDDFQVEQPYGNMRPDGCCICGYKGYTHYLFIEVQISNNPFNFSKYLEYYKSKEYLKYFTVFPKIIILSDKNIEIPKTELRFIKISTDCKEVLKCLDC